MKSQERPKLVEVRQFRNQCSLELLPPHKEIIDTENFFTTEGVSDVLVKREKKNRTEEGSRRPVLEHLLRPQLSQGSDPVTLGWDTTPSIHVRVTTTGDNLPYNFPDLE